MTHIRRILTIALAAGLAVAAHAQAPAPAPAPAQPKPQAPGPAPESLIDIYKRALDADPAFKEAEAQYLVTTQTKPLARSSILPNLQLSANTQTRNSDIGGGALSTVGIAAGNRTVIDADSHGWQVSLSQTVFDWGQFKTLKQADKRVAQAETTYEAAKQDLTTRVAARYFNVLAAEDNVASAQSAREAISRQLEQAQRRFEVGLIAITDVQQSQAGYDNAVAAEIAAQQVLSTAHEFLREIIGEDVAKIAGPKEEFPLLTPDPASQDAWVKRALDANLVLISTRLNLDIANDQTDIDRGSRLPKLSLSASYADSNQTSTQTVFPLPGVPFTSPTTPTVTSYALSLTFPIYNGGFNGAKIQQDVYNSRLNQQTVERITRQTERQTRDSYLTVISDISRVRALKQSVESNRTALRATEAGFEVGTQTTVDVLAAQNSLSSAETSYSQARYNYLLAVLALKQASGSLSEADIMEIDGWLE
ncbi:MAG TPA: TolC family outer membrane protein [Gammaproteobacteria bacterium]|nr:TolC family outer membrane protein [Gammaproteobacteria bacterium]